VKFACNTDSSSSGCDGMLDSASRVECASDNSSQLVFKSVSQLPPLGLILRRTVSANCRDHLTKSKTCYSDNRNSAKDKNKLDQEIGQTPIPSSVDGNKFRFLTSPEFMHVLLVPSVDDKIRSMKLQKNEDNCDDDGRANCGKWSTLLCYVGTDEG